MTDYSRRAILTGLASSIAFTGCTTAEQEAILGAVLNGQGKNGLSNADAVAGIRAALTQGTGSAIDIVSVVGGYLLDDAIKIPLPGSLRNVQSKLASFGLSGPLDNLQTQLNRGAEKAAPLAKNLFVSAITSMSVEDAIGIVRGGNNSATTFLKQKTTPQLTNLFLPIMENALQQAGAIQTFDQIVSQLSNIPLAPQLGADAKQDLLAHGVSKGLGGIFYYIGKEEQAIRSDPSKRGLEILQRVFG